MPPRTAGCIYTSILTTGTEGTGALAGLALDKESENLSVEASAFQPSVA